MVYLVDDLLTKYVGEEHANPLFSVLKEHYDVSVDRQSSKYGGINLDWGYNHRKVHFSIPGYCKEALARFWRETRKKRHKQHTHTTYL